MEKIVIIAGSIVGVVLLIFFFSYLKYKKIDVPGWFKKIESGIAEVKEVTEIIKDNSTGKLQVAATTASLIEEVALKMVTGTEQKYLSGDVSADARKKTAVQAVQDFLTSQGIKITDELKNVIDLAVSSAVRESDTTELNKLIDEKIVPIQNELKVATKEKAVLETKVTTLQNKLSTIQNTVTPVQDTAATTDKVSQPAQNTPEQPTQK